MKVLMTVASKHGATGEIGAVVADALREAGIEVDDIAPEAVATVDGYDAVVAGSAIYAGRWLDSARKFADRHADPLASLPVWLFTSGPIGDPPLPAEEPPETDAIARRLGARGRRSFAGRLDRSSLGMLERTVTRVLHAPDGDFRDWESVRGWADEIARSLRTPSPALDREEVTS
jgi:menaquinone-dependent protoporphyrinogen oxidase